MVAMNFPHRDEEETCPCLKLSSHSCLRRTLRALLLSRDNAQGRCPEASSDGSHMSQDNLREHFRWERSDMSAEEAERHVQGEAGSVKRLESPWQWQLVKGRQFPEGNPPPKKALGQVSRDMGLTIPISYSQCSDFRGTFLRGLCRTGRRISWPKTKEVISLQNLLQPNIAQKLQSGSSPFDFPSEISNYFPPSHRCSVVYQKTNNNLILLSCSRQFQVVRALSFLLLDGCQIQSKMLELSVYRNKVHLKQYCDKETWHFSILIQDTLCIE